jgi:hypothetical protein
MVDPSLFRVVLLPLQKLSPSEFGKKSEGCHIFSTGIIDQHSYQRFFQKTNF